MMMMGLEGGGICFFFGMYFYYMVCCYYYHTVVSCGIHWIFEERDIYMVAFSSWGRERGKGGVTKWRLRVHKSMGNIVLMDIFVQWVDYREVGWVIQCFNNKAF